MNRFVIAEPDKCIGCRTCEVACVLAHPTGAENDLTPENFRPRLRLVKGLKLTAPVQCRQCENAPCVNVCPTNALVYSADTVQLIQGALYRLPDMCAGMSVRCDGNRFQAGRASRIGTGDCSQIGQDCAKMRFLYQCP